MGTLAAGPLQAFYHGRRGTRLRFQRPGPVCAAETGKRPAKAATASSTRSKHCHSAGLHGLLPSKHVSKGLLADRPLLPQARGLPRALAMRLNFSDNISRRQARWQARHTASAPLPRTRSLRVIHVTPCSPFMARATLLPCLGPRTRRWSKTRPRACCQGRQKRNCSYARRPRVRLDTSAACG